MKRLNHIISLKWRVLALCLVLFPSVAIIEEEIRGNERGTAVITGIVLAITASIIFWYTVETYRLRKSASQSNTFSALTQIHGTFSNEMSYRMREYLHTGFDAALLETTEAVLGSEYVHNKAINISKVLNDLKADKDKLVKFNEKLKTYCFGFRETNHTALEAVERLLLDFDIVALPLALSIELAMEAAKPYTAVLERTAIHILPFVAIQKQLRGSDDREYKKHYLNLLDKLKILDKVKAELRLRDNDIALLK